MPWIVCCCGIAWHSLALTPAQAAALGQPIDMENYFSRLALDIIGKAVFNYEFDSLTHDDPVIQVRGGTCLLAMCAPWGGDMGAWGGCEGWFIMRGGWVHPF